MIDMLHQFATGNLFPVTVLAAATTIIVIEAFRVSRRALWGDFFTEDFEE